MVHAKYHPGGGLQSAEPERLVVKSNDPPAMVRVLPGRSPSSTAAVQLALRPPPATPAPLLAAQQRRPLCPLPPLHPLIPPVPPE